MESLLEQGKLTLIKAASVAGVTDVTSDVIDTAGYAGVLMFTTFGVITGTAVTSIKAQEGDKADGSDMADLAGSGITVADDDDGQTFGIDLNRPRKRYVRLYVDRGTANAVIGEIYALKYGAHSRPVTNSVVDTLTAKQLTSPLEGTP